MKYSFSAVSECFGEISSAFWPCHMRSGGESSRDAVRKQDCLTISNWVQANRARGTFVRKVLVSFASQISAALFSPKLLFAIGIALACGSASMAQVSFLGAQRTVTTTGLSGPNGAATDSSGNLYVADTGNNRIVKIGPTGTQTVVSVSP